MRATLILMMTLTLATSALCPPAYAIGDMQNSPALVQQMGDDFAEGKIGFRKDSISQVLDEQTRKDLELQQLIDLISEFAPSQMAKDRIAWQFNHPYLDTKEVEARQVAIRQIATNEELFTALSEVFEIPARGALANKIETFFKTADSLRRQAFIKMLPKGRIGLGRTGLIVLSAWLQWNFFQETAVAALNPTWNTVYPALFSLAMIGYTSRFYQAHLPLLETGRRAAQEKALQNLPQGALSLDSELLEQIDQVCTDNAKCARKVRFWGRFHPLKRQLAIVTQLLGLSPYLSFPLSVYVQTKREQVYAIVAAMTELEVLYAYAKFYRLNSPELNFPTVDASRDGLLDIVDGHHPTLWMKKGPSIPNSVHLDGIGVKTQVLTGPNTGGKTTYEQMSLLLPIMGMCGLPVPATSMRFSPAYIFTNFTTNKGKVNEEVSTFEAQARRVAEVTHVVLNPDRQWPILMGMDEVLTGTSGPEHKAYERSTLAIIHETPGALLTVATHDRSLTNITNELNVNGDEGIRVENMRVGLSGHQILKGASTDYNAIDVMRKVGAPEILIERSLQYLHKIQDASEGSCAEALAGEE